LVPFGCVFGYSGSDATENAIFLLRNDPTLPFQKFWTHLLKGFIDLWVFQPLLFKFGDTGHGRLNGRLNGVIIRGNPAILMTCHHLDSHACVSSFHQ